MLSRGRLTDIIGKRITSITGVTFPFVKFPKRCHSGVDRDANVERTRTASYGVVLGATG